MRPGALAEGCRQMCSIRFMTDSPPAGGHQLFGYQLFGYQLSTSTPWLAGVPVDS
jgi:hypothetical protein